MKCQTCKSSMSNYEFFCPKCGTQTPLLAEKLSARLALREAWAEFRGVRAHFYGFAVFYVLLVLVPVFAAGFWLPMLEMTGKPFADYLLHNAIMLVLVPLALLPLGQPERLLSGRFGIADYFASFRQYLPMFGFVLLMELYFFALKYVCDGLPANDPILHLVRLVLVLYGLAIVLPVPVLMARHHVCTRKAIYIAYKAGRHTRWQQFFLLVICSFWILLSAVPVGLGLLVSIPFTLYVLASYVRRMHEQRMFAAWLPNENGE